MVADEPVELVRADGEHEVVIEGVDYPLDIIEERELLPVEPEERK